MVWSQRRQFQGTLAMCSPSDHDHHMLHRPLSPMALNQHPSLMTQKGKGHWFLLFWPSFLVLLKLPCSHSSLYQFQPTAVTITNTSKY